VVLCSYLLSLLDKEEDADWMNIKMGWERNTGEKMKSDKVAQ
jgi:hypothetical protein